MPANMSALARAARDAGLDVDSAEMTECDEGGVMLQFTKGERSSSVWVTSDELSDPTCDMAARFKPTVVRDLALA